MTIEEFGKTIKQKYPQYKDMGDAEVGQKVLDKYPQYRDMVSVGNKPPKKTFIEKAGDFLGIGTFAKGIGLSLARLTPEIREIENKINKGMATPEELNFYYKQYAEEAPIGKQIIGSALQTGATIATAGIEAGKILPTALKFGGMGAIAGFGKGLEESKNFRESAKQAFISGTISFGIAGAFGLATKEIQKVLAKSPKKLYDSALRVNEKIIRQGKSPSETLIEDGTFGGLGEIMKSSQEGIDEMNGQIANKINIKKALGSINTKEILEEVTERMTTKYGRMFSEAEIEAVINSLPVNTLKVNKTISYQTANGLRQQLDRLVSGKFEQEVLRGSLKEKAIYHTTNILTNQKQKATGTQQQFAKLTDYIRASQLAEKAIAHADKYWGLGLKDLVVGATLGLGGGGPAGGIVGAAVSRGLKEPVIKTTTAILLDRINQGIQKLPVDAMGRISRVVLVNLIKQISGD